MDLTSIRRSRDPSVLVKGVNPFENRTTMPITRTDVRTVTSIDSARLVSVLSVVKTCRSLPCHNVKLHDVE